MTINSRMVYSVGGVILLALLFRALSPILMPFAIAAVLAYIGDPLVDRLEERRIGRSAAVVIVFSCLTLVSLIIVLVTLPILLDQVQLLITRLHAFVQWFQAEALPQLRAFLDLPDRGQPPIDSAKEALSKNWNAAGGVLLYLWQKISGSSMAFITWMANVALIPVVTFYLLRDWDLMTAAIRKLLPRSREQLCVDLATECDDILGAFARGQLLVMLALAAIYTIGLWAVGVDLALVLGLVAGLASIVPYLGFLVGIVAAGVAAYFQFGLSWELLAVAGVFGVGQVLESVLLTPTLVGDKIGLHPVMVIFAVLAGGQLFGFLGVLLALPAAAVFKVLFSYLHQRYLISQWYSEGGLPLTPTDEESLSEPRQ